MSCTCFCLFGVKSMCVSLVMTCLVISTLCDLNAGLCNLSVTGNISHDSEDSSHVIYNADGEILAGLYTKLFNLGSGDILG